MAFVKGGGWCGVKVGRVCVVKICYKKKHVVGCQRCQRMYHQNLRGMYVHVSVCVSIVGNINYFEIASASHCACST